MNITCTTEWSKQSELSYLNDCIVSTMGVYVLKGIVVALSSIIFFSELIMLIHKQHEIFQKGTATIVLLFWTFIQNILMGLRPLLGLTMNITPANTLWLAFITHISGASAAGIVILFVYIQIQILVGSSLGGSHWLYSNKKIILLLAGIIQAILFFIGPFLAQFANVPLYRMFWAPVILVDFTIIPYFCILGIILYNRINEVNVEKRKALSKRLLITIVSCSILGLFTGCVGIYSISVNTHEWVLIELCWLADIIFNTIFFSMFIHKKSRSEN